MTVAATRALAGRRVVITRPRLQAASLVAALEEHGAEVLEFPTIQVQPVADLTEVDAAIEALPETDWVIFTSVNGVEQFCDRLEAVGAGSAALSACHVASIGPATAEALRERGVTPERVPDRYQAEGLLEALGDEGWSGRRVLIPRAAKAREILPEDLRRRGARVDVVPVYRTVRPDLDPEPLRQRLVAREVDAITFTSSSTVTNFIAFFPGEEARSLLEASGAAVACIGPITAGTAREAGFPVAVEADEFTVAGLVQALVDHLGSGR